MHGLINCGLGCNQEREQELLESRTTITGLGARVLQCEELLRLVINPLLSRFLSLFLLMADT